MQEPNNKSQDRGRPASFSREELIHEVTEMFWTYGYNNLSLNIIAQKTSLKRSSLYNSFKTKEALFSECLDYYLERSPTQYLHNYKKGDSVSALMHQMFNEICVLRANDKANRGCLSANVYDELATTPTTLGEKLRKLHLKRRKRIAEIVNQAIKQNELPSDTSAPIVSNIIMSFMSGLNIHVKQGMSKKDLQNMSAEFLEKMGFLKQKHQ